MSKFTHIDEKGQVRMVDVTAKKITSRTANRDWISARTWLWREMTGEDAEAPAS